MSIQALWSKLWGRGVSISIQFSGWDAGNDVCKACGRKRKMHRRGDDHIYVEASNEK